VVGPPPSGAIGPTNVDSGAPARGREATAAKGGITSGVVYPVAAAKLAKQCRSPGWSNMWTPQGYSPIRSNLVLDAAPPTFRAAAMGRTATPVANGATKPQSAACNEFQPPLLNEVQRLLTARFRVRIPAPEPKLNSNWLVTVMGYDPTTSVLHQYYIN
jgi:hypothetical protein